MKFMTIAVKGIKESLRDIKSLGFLLIFPILFLVMFRAAFGWGPESTDTYEIVVLDMDNGEGPWDQQVPEWLMIVNMQAGTNRTATQFFQEDILQGHDTAGTFLIEEVLKVALYGDNETKMFSVTMVDSIEEGEDLVSKDEAVALVIIPANYTSSIQGIVDQAVVDEVRAHSIPMNASSTDYAHTTIDLSGGLGSYDYSFASSLVQGQVMGYVGVLESIVRIQVGAGLPGGPVSNEGGSVGIKYVSIGDTEDFTVFDWQAPGIFIFALLMTAIFVSATLATEYKNKTVHRMRLTKMTSLDLMTGTTLRWLFIGGMQIVILFFFAWILGTKVSGDLGPTFAMCFVVSMVVVLASISLGLIISAFVEDPEQAGNVGTGIAIPLSFLTGAFFPIEFAPAQVIPWTHGANAMKQLMLYNAWDEALIHLGWAFAGAIVLFIIGVFIYQQRRLRNL